MIRSGAEGHIVNTASAAGLSPGTSIYGVTKHAVVALSEALYVQLAAARSKIDVSVLCPGYVKTNIMDSHRNRPKHLDGAAASSADAERRDRAVADLVRMGMEPSEVADEVVAGISQRRFCILAMKLEFKERFRDVVRRRAEVIGADQNPDLAPYGTDR